MLIIQPLVSAAQGLYMALPVVLSASIFNLFFYFILIGRIHHSSRKLANVNSILLKLFYEASITLIHAIC